jgi:hypothetical protein
MAYGTKLHENKIHHVAHVAVKKNTLPLKLLFSCFFIEKAIVPKVYGTMHTDNRIEGLEVV